MTKNELLNTITEFYLKSRDFNGYPLRQLKEAEDGEVVDHLRSLVRDGLVSIIFGDRHPNPHIRAIEDETPAAVLVKIATKGLGAACAYPTTKHLQMVVNAADYDGRPYALGLALGGAQLSHRAFDLHVLETYRNDPRFYYDTDDIFGQIYLEDGAVGVKKQEDVYLRFGFSYDDDDNKYVAVFLWDLFKLTPEAQQQWKMRETDTPTNLHPDYFRTQIIGDFPERMSIYDAFTYELKTINEMAQAMGRPNLFRNDYYRARPKGFSSLLRPTVREMNDFVRLLDGMISDNINLKFFKDDVALEKEIDLGNGRFRVERKGTLQILEEWIRSKFRPKDEAPMNALFVAFRDVRKLRNKPAHAHVEDKFDAAIGKQQRELVLSAYEAVRTLRLVLANHPLAKEVEVDEFLYEGRIWSM
jgi:hypothetical protein